MATNEWFEALKGRLTELENRSAVRSREEPAGVTRAEFDAFVKVHRALTDRLLPGDLVAFQPCWPSFKPDEEEEVAAFLGLAPRENPPGERGADRISGLGE